MNCSSSDTKPLRDRSIDRSVVRSASRKTAACPRMTMRGIAPQPPDDQQVDDDLPDGDDGGCHTSQTPRPQPAPMTSSQPPVSHPSGSPGLPRPSTDRWLPGTPSYIWV